MAKDDFYIVNSWMIEDLELSGVELQCFAIIWSLSRGEKQMYIGGNSLLIKMTKRTEPTVISALKKLCKKGFIKKVSVIVNNVERNYYKAISQGTKEILVGGLNNLSGGTKKILAPNIESNNKEINKEKELLKNNSKKENIDFEFFYGNYPLKKSRKTAEKAWSKLSLKDKKKAIEMLPDYIDDCIENNRNYQYPATYLNKATFNDQFGDKEEKEEMPAGMSSLQWNEIQKWMLDVIPRIAHLITPDMFLSFKPMVRFKSKLLSHILQDINNSDYEGDILAEFERISGTEEYLKQILNDDDTAY